MLPSATLASRQPALFACARRDDEDWLLAFSSNDTLCWQSPLSGRGHGITLNDASILVISRRPGAWALILDRVTGVLQKVLRPPEGLIYTGHACVGDGCWFVGCQTRQGSVGRILKIDRSGSLMKTISSGGIEPHELVVGGKSLFVANGGRVTDPDLPEVILNSDSIYSTLTKIDVSNGVLVDRIFLPKNLSCRHLAVSASGLVGACQWQGVPVESPPLLWVLDGSKLSPLPGPAGSSTVAVRGYLGSVVWWNDKIVASAPRGDQYWVVDPRSGIGVVITEPDICGLAAYSNQLRFSSGRGVIGSPGDKKTMDWVFDNHMTSA